MLLPQKLSVFWAAGPFTPRKERVVTRHELWYRYVPESGKWHDGTCTRKIEVFSAATCPGRIGDYSTNPPTDPDVKIALIRFLGTARFHTARWPDIADNPRHLSPSALQHN